jgi:hypothetical protein
MTPFVGLRSGLDLDAATEARFTVSSRHLRLHKEKQLLWRSHLVTELPFFQTVCNLDSSLFG